MRSTWKNWLFVVGALWPTLLAGQANSPLVAPLRFVEELRIGALDGDPNYLFGNVTAVATSADGSVFVYDRQVQTIRLFDSGGRFVRLVARSGEGPGEVQGVTGMLRTPNNEIAVWDPANQRISLFNPSGEFVTSHRVIADGNIGGFTVDRPGRFYIRSIVRSTRNQAFDWDYEWVRVDRDGVVVDTLSVPPRASSPPEVFGLSSGDGMRWSFPEATEHAITRDGHVLAGRSDEYRIEIDRGSGAEPFYERTVERIRLSGEERDFWESMRERHEERTDIRYQAMPRVKPVFRTLIADPAGRVWVERYVEARHFPQESTEDRRPAYEWREPTTFDVLLEDGNWLGTVTMPTNSIPLHFSNELVWGRLRGDFDEHYVVAWRLVPGG